MRPAGGSIYLFVYGLLRSGQSDHHRLKGADFLGMHRSAAHYTLIDLGEYPALVEGGSDAVAGELYRVPADLLADLDAFEDAPRLYERRRIPLEGGHEAETYLWCGARDAGKRIPSADWQSHARR